MSDPRHELEVEARTNLRSRALNVMTHANTVVPVGRIAPAFTAPDDRGVPVSLADFRGQFVVLFFYPKDDTPG